MLRHKLLHHILLLYLITRREPHLLLPLIKHHLLNATPSFRVQIRQFAALWFNLLSVNLGFPFHTALPPLHLVLLCQEHRYDLLILDVPEAVVRLDSIEELSIDDWFLSFETNFQTVLLDLTGD